MIGKTLAHYKILEKIGAGGMGEVYRARDQQLDRDVALKLLPQAWSRDSVRVRRFEREAKTLASLEHPNIATVYGFHEDHGVHVLAMELVHGDTLTSCITAGGLPLERLVDIGIPLAEAVAFAHEKGVIHRDLKPANVMLDASGRIRVLDFGVAGLLQSASDRDADATLEALTGESEIVGTVAYMAPEQLEGRTVDPRADVFAMGVVLYELATGTRPFRADSTAGLASAILRDEPAPLREVRPDLPADLGRVIRRCLEKTPGRRLQTATDVRNELEDLRLGIRTDGTPATTGAPEHLGLLAEGRMTITTEHVRSLSTRIPRMVGDSMTYLDNGRDSDVLVIFVHGIGGDQRDFEHLLRQTPYRATAVSLYGFGPIARMRPPLPYADHNRLLSFLAEDIRRRVAPRSLVLVGFSSGADQVLQIMAPPDGDRIRPDGLLFLGPTVRPGTGSGVSGAYSGMSDDPSDILRAIRTVAANADDLNSWLQVHEYLVHSFGKFGTNVAPLREFALGYIASCREETFFELFRATLERVRNVRCVFAEDERDDADYVLERHIGDNALGDLFSEEMIVADAARRHVELLSAGALLPQVEDVVRRAREKPRKVTS